jgi:hypothetical protein
VSVYPAAPPSNTGRLPSVGIGKMNSYPNIICRRARVPPDLVAPPLSRSVRPGGNQCCKKRVLLGGAALQRCEYRSHQEHSGFVLWTILPIFLRLAAPEARKPEARSEFQIHLVTSDLAPVPKLHSSLPQQRQYMSRSAKMQNRDITPLLEGFCLQLLCHADFGSTSWLNPNISIDREGEGWDYQIVN